MCVCPGNLFIPFYHQWPCCFSPQYTLMSLWINFLTPGTCSHSEAVWVKRRMGGELDQRLLCWCTALLAALNWTCGVNPRKQCSSHSRVCVHPLCWEVSQTFPPVSADPCVILFSAFVFISKEKWPLTHEADSFQYSCCFWWWLRLLYCMRKKIRAGRGSSFWKLLGLFPWILLIKKLRKTSVYLCHQDRNAWYKTQRDAAY